MLFVCFLKLLDNTTVSFIYVSSCMINLNMMLSKSSNISSSEQMLIVCFLQLQGNTTVSYPESVFSVCGYTLIQSRDN